MGVFSMSLLVCVRAVKNLNSGRFFALVHEEPDQKMVIINPKGDILTVPGGLFADPEPVTSEAFADYFTSEQIAAFGKAFGRGKGKSAGSKPGPSRPKRPVKKKKVEKQYGVGAEWNSGRLTFYKHKIEPLSETQSFKIYLEDAGVFMITKADFLRMFNDVVISNDYWEEGSFTYRELPEKAKKFIRAA